MSVRQWVLSFKRHITNYSAILLPGIYPNKTKQNKTKVVPRSMYKIFPMGKKEKTANELKKALCS